MLNPRRLKQPSPNHGHILVRSSTRETVLAMSLMTIGLWLATILLVAAAAGIVAQWRSAGPTHDPSAPAASIPPPPRRGHYLTLLIVFAFGALYGSLVPFQFAALGFDVAPRRFGQLWGLDVSVNSRSDWLANVLLGLPLGFCGLAAIAADRQGWGRALWQSSLVIFLCACFSATLEFQQFWCPPRTSSQNDIAAQVLGAALGTGLWLMKGQFLTNWARGFFSTTSAHNRINRLLQAYCAMLFFYSLLPFNITLSPVELLHKLRDRNLVVLQPFTGEEFAPPHISDTLGRALLFATLGMLAADARSSTSKHPRPVLQALLFGLCLSTAIEVAQLFVVNRYTKISDIILSTAAAMLGGWISRCIF